MKTPDQLEKKIQKYWKLDLTPETQEKLVKVAGLCEMKLSILDRARFFIRRLILSKFKEGYRRGLERELLRKELKPFSYDNDLSTRRKTERLRSIIDKTLCGKELSIVEYNWIKKELEKVD